MAWVYTPGSILGQSGTAVSIAGNIDDIIDNPRPGRDGYVSIGAYEQQYVTTNAGAATYGKFILDAGAVYMNFVSQDDPGILLGATREGNVFTIEQEIKDMVIDGAKGLVKGGRRFVKVNAKLTCHFIEHTIDLWQMALPGSETTSIPGHVALSRNLAITDADYVDNIVIIAQMSGTGQVMICGVKNALADGNFEMGTEDSNERGLTVIFTAHFDKLKLNQEPWILMYPEGLI